MASTGGVLPCQSRKKEEDEATLPFSLFVNLTHPSQLQREDYRRSIKVFVGKSSSKQTTIHSSRAVGKEQGKADHQTKRTGGPVVLRWKPALGTRSLRQVTLLPATIGGLRKDSFDSYPVEATPCVAESADHFIHVFAPSHVWRADMLEEGTTELFRNKLVQFAMQHAIVFECIVAAGQAVLSAHSMPKRRPPKEVLHHYGNAIASLRQRLASTSEAADDATLWTIALLMGIDYFYRSWDSLAAHFNGLRQLVRRRGGAGSLGWQGVLESSYSAWELTWAPRTTLAEQLQRKNGKLEYSELALPSELIQSVSILPEGFRQLALVSALSAELIQLLVQATLWTQKSSHCLSSSRPDKAKERMMHCLAVERHVTQDCIEMLEPYLETTLERVLCVGLTAYCLDALPPGPLTRQSYDPLHRQCQRMEGREWQESEADCIMWVAVAIARTEDLCPVPLRNRWLLFDWMLEKHEWTRSWSEVHDALAKFLWSDSFEEKWKRCWEVGMARKRNCEVGRNEAWWPH